METSSPLTPESFELSVEFQNTLIEIPNATDSACKKFSSLLVQVASAFDIPYDSTVGSEESTTLQNDILQLAFAFSDS